jgi:outer membrane receptor protein involved in Fe transport
VTTGADGRYRLSVPAGVPFEIQVHLEGFAAQSVTLAGTTTPVSRDIELGIGNVSDTLVVTAARGAEGRSQVTSSVSVLSADDIHAIGASQLSEILRQVPGVNIEGTGREGGLMSMFSRGGESDYNLVLVDGVRMNANGGAFDFGRINADEIERVEVVRGAQSITLGVGRHGRRGPGHHQTSRRRRPAGGLRVARGGSFATLRSDVRSRRGRPPARGLQHRRRASADGRRVQGHPAGTRLVRTDGGQRSVGASLGSRATIRSSLRYSDSQGKSVGNIDYGTRDRGTVYENKDLTWHLETVTSSRFAVHRHGDGELLPSERAVRRYHRRPTFNVYTCSKGHLAPFPNGPRLVRLLTQSEFDSLSANPSALGRISSSRRPPSVSAISRFRARRSSAVRPSGIRVT